MSDIYIKTYHIGLLHNHIRNAPKTILIRRDKMITYVWSKKYGWMDVNPPPPASDLILESEVEIPKDKLGFYKAVLSIL